MVGSEYRPDVAAAKAAGRAHDILHDHARFYRTSYTDFAIDRSAREAEHGNIAPKAEERYHYHYGLGRGENTLNAHLARVLMRAVVAEGRYRPEAFLEAFVAHMTTPGLNRDPYTEVYLRRWFEHYAEGLPLHLCAHRQRDSWSVGSHGGMHRALMVAMLARDAYQGLGLGIEHQVLTHRSENVASALGVLTPVLHDLLAGAEAAPTLRAAAGRIRAPAIPGEEMLARYREAQGPGNIPKREMWEIHTELSDAAFDVDALLAMPADAVIRRTISTACYAEHGLPLMLYLALAEGCDFEAALLANANAGGDNVNRGLVLGMAMGAASEIPGRLKDGLADRAALADEIGGFAEIAAGGRGF